MNKRPGNRMHRLAPRPLAIAILLSGAAVASSAALGGVFGIAGGKSAVAKKIAEFKDTLVIGGIRFSPDGRQIVTNGDLDLWEVHIWNWKSAGRGFRTLSMSSDSDSRSGMGFSPDGTQLAVAHQPNFNFQKPVQASQPNRVIQVWDPRTGQAMADVDMNPWGGDVGKISYIGDGAILVVLQRGSYITALDTQTWKRAWNLDIGSAEFGDAQLKTFGAETFSVSPDESRIAIAGATYRLRQNPKPGESAVEIQPCIVIVRIGDRKIIQEIPSPFSAGNYIQALEWNANGRYLAAGIHVHGGALGTTAVKIFDLEAGKSVMEAGTEQANITDLVYVGNKYLIEGMVDMSVRIWDDTHTKLLQSIPVDGRLPFALAVSKDQKNLALASGKNVTVFDLR